ncbi:MAG: flagellar hook-basal body complex protein FliE [Deltaproteobacteria bacterium]|nr:flagellar hook-basal body complex protein FliE [Deltaproteobacteria bacterium]
MAFDPFIASLPSAAGQPRAVRSIAKAPSIEGAEESDGSFASHLEKALDGAETSNKEANVQVDKAAVGEANLHELALSMEKADINMRLLLKTRNKLVDAYQEIMRMPV